MSNVVTQLAKIIRNKLVRTINGISPVSGNIQLGGPNLLYGTSATDRVNSGTGWGSVVTSSNGHGFVPNMSSRYIYASRIYSDVPVQLEAVFYDSSSKRISSKVGNTIPANTSDTSEIVFDMTSAVLSNTAVIEFHTIFSSEQSDTHVIHYAKERLFEGDVLFPYCPAPVYAVGGQAAANINMDAYALKADITALNNKIADLETQIKGGTN